MGREAGEATHRRMVASFGVRIHVRAVAWTRKEVREVCSRGGVRGAREGSRREKSTGRWVEREEEEERGQRRRERCDGARA